MEYKRHVPAKKSTAKAKGGVRTAIVIVLSLILAAAIIVLSPAGDFLLNTVIIPVFSKTPEKDEDNKIVSALKQQDEEITLSTPTPQPTEKAHKVLTIDETQFFILQMGSFLEYSAAEDHADEIRRLGAGGTVFKDGSVYRVFAAAYQDEDSLKKVQAQVRSDGFEATPYITEKKAVKLTLEGDPEAVKAVEKAIQLLNQTPRELSDMTLSYDKNELSATDLHGMLKKMYINCKDLAEALTPLSNADVGSIRDLLEKYTENLSTFLDEHDTMNIEMISGDLKYLQLSVISDYILFFEQE